MSDRPINVVLAKLPDRAIVAYAYRCMMRVQPLYRSPSEEGDEALNHYGSLEQALELTSDFAAGRSSAQDPCVVSATAVIAADAAVFGEALAGAAGSDLGKIVKRVIVHRITKSDDFVLDPSPNGPLGPLWPKGDPAWYAEAAAEQVAEIERLHRRVHHPDNERLVIRVEESEVADSDQVATALTHLHAAMNECRIANRFNIRLLDDRHLDAPSLDPPEAQS